MEQKEIFQLFSKIPKNKLPKHIGIIMDGNSRWATQKGISRIEGHKSGSESAKNLLDNCLLFKIPVVTLYTFSTENWQRSPEEVNAIMQLLLEMSEKYSDDIQKKNVHFKVIGDSARLDSKIRKNLLKIEEKTKGNTKMTLCMAINYGSRNEIIRATQKIMKDFYDKKIKIEQVDERFFTKYLDTADLPDVDLIVRTSGEQRISNFLLWQSAYAELYFTNTFWPDFSLLDLYQSIVFFSSRKRSKGKRLNEKV